MIIHVCVRLEFLEVSAHAPCLRISELNRLVSGFTPNTCVLPLRGRVGLVDHPHPPPAVARGHRLVFVATAGTICCRSALFCAGRHFVWPRWHFLPADCCSSAFADILGQLYNFFSPPYTCVEGSPSCKSLSCKLYKRLIEGALSKGKKEGGLDILEREKTEESSGFLGLGLDTLTDLSFPLILHTRCFVSHYCTQTPSVSPSSWS